MPDKLYHVHPDTDRIGTCDAHKIGCPFGKDARHFTSREDARAYLEEKYSAEESKRPVVMNKLKEMDANALSRGLLRQFKANGWDVERAEHAIALANILHQGQRRRNRGDHETTPYIEHPLRVAYRMTKFGVKDEGTVLAGILHDTVEDGTKNFYANVLEEPYPATEQEARERLLGYIAEHYGQETADTVHSVTNEIQERKDWATKTNAERFQVYADHLRDEVVDNPKAFMVKLGDFIDNATGLYHNDVPGFEKKIVKMAAKYNLCIPIFEQEIQKNQNNLAPGVVEDLMGQMTSTRERLGNILNKYSDLLAA